MAGCVYGRLVFFQLAQCPVYCWVGKHLEAFAELGGEWIGDNLEERCLWCVHPSPPTPLPCTQECGVMVSLWRSPACIGTEAASPESSLCGFIPLSAYSLEGSKRQPNSEQFRVALCSLMLADLSPSSYNRIT